MKKILFLSAFVLVALVSSCKKDDPKPEELIVGRWTASSAVIGSTDVLIPTASTKTELEVEFTSGGAVTFFWTNTVLTTNPNGVFESSLNGTYSWNNGALTITVQSGADVKTVTGTMDITESHFLFTGTSGDITTFISLLEAHK